MRKRCHRRPIVPMPPRGLRPKLDRGQLLDLSLVHLENLDAIARGGATSATLWDAVAAAYTWSRVAELLDIGLDEMAEQLHMLEAVVQRFKRTGRIGFAGLEYQTARRGVDVMDELARIVDQPTASAAADWSEARINALLAQQASGATPTLQPQHTPEQPHA